MMMMINLKIALIKENQQLITFSLFTKLTLISNLADLFDF